MVPNGLVMGCFIVPSNLKGIEKHAPHVTPEQAGVGKSRKAWIPAFAGMTKAVLLVPFQHLLS